jgi:catechol 2,3-dioxygenase-like lactoylglutathione lyase family enzyme
MIGYVTIGTNDIQKAAPFYDTLAELMDTPRMMEGDNFIAWGTMEGGAGIGLTKPFNGEPATVGNGVMIALLARDPDHVNEIYNAAIAAGGTDEGAPGLRGGGFYAGYFRDLDGNKLNAFCMGVEG